MKSYAWFQLLVRAIGLLLMGLATPYLLYPVQSIAVILEPAPYMDSLSSKIGSAVFSLGILGQMFFGLYLFFGAKRIVMRCIRAVDGHCAACGYDLRGLSEATCPECGLATARSVHEETERDAHKSAQA